MTAGTRYRHLKPRGSWVYLLAALPPLVLALLVAEHGASAIYLSSALLCVILFFRPTKPVWLALFVLYLAGTTDYVVALIKDIAQLAGGRRPSVLLDRDDTFFFVLLVIYLVAMCYGLFRVRPMFRGDSRSAAADP